MTDVVVVNTGPLIALHTAGALVAVGRLELEFVSPEEVRAELDRGSASGHATIDPDWLTVKPLAHELDPVATAVLDAGEAAVIQLAREIACPVVCLDERKARSYATAIGLTVVGSLGLMLRAKQAGHLASMRKSVDALREAGEWFDEELLRRVLDAAGEADG